MTSIICKVNKRYVRAHFGRGGYSECLDKGHDVILEASSIYRAVTFQVTCITIWYLIALCDVEKYSGQRVHQFIGHGRISVREKVPDDLGPPQTQDVSIDEYRQELGQTWPRRFPHTLFVALWEGERERPRTFLVASAAQACEDTRVIPAFDGC
jgi:hypothetical protein